MNLFKVYIAEFKRNFGLQRFIMVFYVIFISIGTIFIKKASFTLFNGIVGLLIFLALISGSFHVVSLPMMMYIVPYTKKMREDYIQKLLNIKVGIPLTVSACVDIIVLICDRTLLRTIILQLVTVFFISYLFGTLNYEHILNVYKPAFGGLREYNGAILMLCYLLSYIMYYVCLSQISNVEFWIILAVILIIFGTISLNVHKRWSIIRSNLASYEMVTEMEVK
jgi:hypothetical protein